MALKSPWKVVKSAELKKLLGHSKMKEWSVYIIRCRDRSLYTGISTDVQRRVGEHISGGRTAAKYTKSFSSIELAYEIRNSKQIRMTKIRVI
jgi:predicted GIY-YIG superfamily endonuclease